MQAFKKIGFPRIFSEPDRDKYLMKIGELATNSGVDPQVAINDSLPLQYIILAAPKAS